MRARPLGLVALTGCFPVVFAAAAAAQPAFQHDPRESDAHIRWSEGDCTVSLRWERDGTRYEERRCGAENGRAPRATPPPAPPAAARESRLAALAQSNPWSPEGSSRNEAARRSDPARIADDRSAIPAAAAEATTLEYCDNPAITVLLGRKRPREPIDAAPYGGAVDGMLIGGPVGRAMVGREQACIAKTLEMAFAGQRVMWRSAADPSVEYAVVPGRVTAGPGGPCRKFEAQLFANGERRHAIGTGCRRSDGAWIAEHRVREMVARQEALQRPGLADPARFAPAG